MVREQSNPDTAKYGWTRPQHMAVERQCHCTALEQANGHSYRCWYGPMLSAYLPTPEPAGQSGGAVVGR